MTWSVSTLVGYAQCEFALWCSRYSAIALTTLAGTCVPPGPSKYATRCPRVHALERGEVRANLIDARRLRPCADATAAVVT